MSVDPGDFINKLFIQFKSPADTSESETVEKLLLKPILEQIKKSGKQDARLQKLAEELKPLKKKQISQLKTEDHQRILRAFATSITSSGYSSFSELQDPLQSKTMSLEKIKENYLRLQQHLFNTFNNPVAVQEFMKEDLGCDIELTGNDFQFTAMPLDLLDQTLLFASTTIEREVDGELFVMPELFIKDNIERKFPYFSSQFESSNKEIILDQSSAKHFMELTRAFTSNAASNLSDQDQKLLFNVILLLKTQHTLNSLTPVAKYFFMKALEELNLLASFCIETSANINFNRNEQEPGTVKVRLEYSHEFVTIDSYVAATPLEYFHEACRDKGVANEVYLRAFVDFIVRVRDQNISFEILSHNGSISFSANPVQLICNCLRLSPQDVERLQAEIVRIKKPLETAFIERSRTITSRGIQASLEQSVQEQIDLTDHLIEHALYEIPVVFERDHIESTALSDTRFSIGGTRALQVTDLEAANTLIENANIFIARLSKDPLIQQTLFNQILCLCSQRLPIALNFIKDTLNEWRATLNTSFNYTTDLKDASVKIGSVKGIVGSKDNELLVSYEYHFDLSPVFRMGAVAVTAEEIAQLEDCKRALNIDRVLSFSTSGSFILEVDKSFIGSKITLKIKDVKHQSRLD